MNKPLPAIQEIQKELNTLSEHKTLAQAKKVILAVIHLLDDSVSPDDQNLFQLFSDSDGKIRANASWFFEDQVIIDRKATYKIHNGNKLNIDFKLYGVTKPSKRTIAWAQALTPNFEDESFNSKYNVGIDFVVPKSADRVIIVLSNNYVVRTLELKGALTATFQEILAKWASISDFSNKKEVHAILWESFDLQPLNKKFYAGISERFITLRQYLTKENILDDKHASLFANRLLGRIIFCWFLDKKGVINPDRKYFDSHAFENSSEYYRKNLENLFFGVLNTPIADREYKDDVTPFLNGGLFEARDTDLYRNSKLSFPKYYFNDLFDFLNGYNFTTDESTSQFQQVAIDPEMLGRIFENLLAEITEDTGEQARKAKGAFYTPREIVDYMCRESLREYLKTKIPEDQFRDQRLVQLIDAPDKDFQDQDHNWRRDWKPYKDGIIEALDELKVLDPACGSGAFPIGMLQLLVRVYERLESRFDSYKTKLAIIEKNIYGVDIEPMAVEIARLRTWLSIIVDEAADSKNIKPLPNLEFKFVCANSLIDLDRSRAVAFGDDPQLAKKLREIRDAYFKTESLNNKKKLRAKYSELVNQGEGLFGESQISKQLKTYRPFDSEQSANFFNPEFIFGTSEFNIIIGNPPYVDSANMVKSDPVMRRKLSKIYSATKGAWDLYVPFFEKSISLLSEFGNVSFIVPNKWLTMEYGGGLRQLLAPGLLSMSNFTSVKVFETASISSIVVLFQKNTTTPIIRIRNYSEISKYSESTAPRSKINLKDFGLLFNNDQLLDRLSLYQTVGDRFSVLASFSTSEAYEFRPLIKECHQDNDERVVKLINTGTLRKYEALWGRQLFKYLKLSFNKPIVTCNEFQKHFPRRYELFDAQKIMISGIRHFRAFLDLEKEFYSTIPTTIIYSPKLNESLELLTGILNSKVMAYFIDKKFQISSMDGGINFSPEIVKSLPIPNFEENFSPLVTNIENLVRKVMLQKKVNPEISIDDDISNIEMHVMSLYKLSDEEKELIMNHKSQT